MYYIGSIQCTEADIRHFGTKGMKWGIRKYQNEDGSLTPAGRERYGSAQPGSTSARDSKKALRRIENDVADYQLKRNTANYRAAKVMNKAANQMIKAERYDEKGNTKKRDKLANKAESNLKKAAELKRSVSDIEKLIKTAEGEQSKHIANLVMNNYGVTAISKTHLQAQKGANALGWAFGAAGGLASLAAYGPGAADYVTKNKFKFKKGGNGYRTVDRTNKRLQSNLERRTDALNARTTAEALRRVLP